MSISRADLENGACDLSEVAAEERLPPLHPGELLAEVMAEAGLSANALSRALDVPVNRVTEILAGRRAVTADTALRLGRYFRTSARLWLNLQTGYDLDLAEREKGATIAQRVRPPAA